MTEKIQKHEKSQEHNKFLEKDIIDKYFEKDKNVDRLKGILKNRIEEHVEIFTNFTIIMVGKLIILNIVSQ